MLCVVLQLIQCPRSFVIHPLILLAARGHQRHCSPAAARHETSKSTANAAISENDEYLDALSFVGRKKMHRNLGKLEPRRRSDSNKTIALTASGFYSVPLIDMKNYRDHCQRHLALSPRIAGNRRECRRMTASIAI
jgi:hypothetical protein